jgi:glycosyltransferase involved in cell wall biosynthesis
MKPITILFVHSSDEMYGTDVILLKLLDRLDRERFKPIVVIPTDVVYQGLLTKELCARNVEVRHMKTAILRRKYFTPGGLVTYAFRLSCSTLRLMSIIKQESVDVVHSNTIAVIPGALAAKFTGRPNIWHVHEIITSPRTLWKFTSWLVPRLSFKVVAVSGPTRQHLCDGDRLNNTKAVVIHNGIDIEEFTPNPGKRLRVRGEWGIRPEQLLIGMIGRFSNWKGQDYFVDVARLVSDEHPDARFILVGGTFPGQEYQVERIRTKINSYGLASKICISDFRSDVPDVLNAFDIFVLPSTLPDPLPTVVLEAMAAGKPVVANAHGGSTEMVKDQLTGLLTEPGKQEIMARAIIRLITNANERSSMGAAGRDRLLTYFSIDTYVSNWSELYEQAVSRGKS